MRWAWGSTPSDKWEEIKDISTGIVSRNDEVYHLETGPNRR
jgi:hypothetical protein